jgi:Uma2 family endonuclease
LAVGVVEYWVINRFKRTLTVFRRGAKGIDEQTITDKEVYATHLLPGFNLPLGKLLAVSDDWKK